MTNWDLYLNDYKNDLTKFEYIYLFNDISKERKIEIIYSHLENINLQYTPSKKLNELYQNINSILGISVLPSINNYINHHNKGISILSKTSMVSTDFIIRPANMYTIIYNIGNYSIRSFTLTKLEVEEYFDGHLTKLRVDNRENSISNLLSDQ